MPNDCPYVSRGGLKLAAALDAFEIDVADRVCADLGCNVGGFTDCLLQQGARRVFAIDTGYGTLDWRLRNDDRVTVLERTNALHLEPTDVADFEPCSLVVIDLGWTRQAHALPAARRWLDTRDANAHVVTLIKPQYEVNQTSGRQKRAGILSEEESQRIVTTTLAEIGVSGWRVLDHITSPIRGGGSRKGKGNVEHLALLSID